MLLKPEQLAEALKKSPLPRLFLVHGEEPLQRVEAADAIRKAAQRAGTSERLRYDAATGIDWDFLGAEIMSLSLFSSSRLFDLDLGAGRKKLDATAAAFIQRWVEREEHDDVLLLGAEAISRDDQQSAWFRALNQRGMVVACKLPEGAEFRRWLQARSLARGKTLEPEAAELLAARTEGNLLAAAQEIDLLMLLVDDSTITLEHALAAVSDSARYDVYKVVDSALDGDVPRAVRMLRGVRDEGSDAIIIGWSAGRDLRVLSKAAASRNPESVFHAEKVWSTRHALLRRALQRHPPASLEALLRESVRIDQMIKGMGEGEPWEALESLLIALAGGPALGALAESGAASRK